MIARLCFALLAGLACAQNSGQLEIRGTVVEGALGVAGATATLFESGPDPAQETIRSPLATTSTDAKGAFQFHPSRAGAYYVEVKKDGYFADSPTGDPFETAGTPVSIDQDHPTRERRFSLMRLGEVQGRVVDEDGHPIPKLAIMVQTTSSSITRAFAEALTDQDGYFAATKLRPGDYLVSVAHKSPEILPQFSDDDLKMVDQDLETSVWPGVPLPVSSGASIIVGTITPRKASYYRARVSAHSSDCAPGERWTFAATTVTAQIVPCGKEFLVRNLAPGSYSFSLSANGRPGENKKWAFASVEVTDRNLEVALSLSSGADISGQLEAANGATLPPTKPRITISPMVPLTGSQMTEPDQAGKFQIRGVPGNRHQVRVIGLASKFYVKEIRYNGLAVTDGIIMPIAGAPGLLSIVIDDKAATISGSVAERDKVPGGVTIVAVKWPLSPDATSAQALGNPNVSIPADDQGRFQIGGLAPGEYRVLAVTAASLSRVQPDIVSRAEKVTLERGDSQTVSLKIVEP